MSQLMKGEVFRDALKLVRGKPRFEYPLWVEVKADEIRCRVYMENGDVKFDSYAEKPLANLHYFASQFRQLFSEIGYTELDVGVLVNGNFNDSYRYVRSTKGLPPAKFDKKTQKESPSLFPEQVEFILFDLPQSGGAFEVRLAERDFVLSRCGKYDLKARTPMGMLAENEGDVWEAYRRFRSIGEEGAMAKTMHHLYSRTRTFDWMKVKPSDDIDGQITGFNQAFSEAGAPLGRVGSVDVLMEDFSTASPAGFNHELARDMWENQSKYMGEWLTFHYMERDRQGGYRHPVFNRFRENKA